MTEKEKLENFDWVTAHAACSLATVFETLKLEVHGDVETRNKLRPEQAHYAFKFVSQYQMFTVSVESNVRHGGVQFILLDKSIQVKNGEDDLLFEGSLTLNDVGECRLQVSGQECTFWQFRRRALEKLFFDVP